MATTPYQEALKWIQSNPTTGGASSLAKLVLSLWNSECCFSYAECVGNLDANLTELTVRMIGQYAIHGETQDLVDVGNKVCELYPRLWELTQAMQDARGTIRKQWEEKRLAAADDQ
jgi:hypothetical protein